MKNNKGFTLIEVLAVVVLLGILSTVATISIYRYKNNAKAKEAITVRSTLSSSFDSYRIKNSINKNQKIGLSSLNLGNKISYDNDKCSKSDLEKGYMLYIVAGDKLSSLTGDDKQKACMQDTTITEDDTSSSKLQGVTACLKDANGNLIPSKEEEYCVYFVCMGEEIINDFNDENSLCSK